MLIVKKAMQGPVDDPEISQTIVFLVLRHCRLAMKHGPFLAMHSVACRACLDHAFRRVEVQGRDEIRGQRCQLVLVQPVARPLKQPDLILTDGQQVIAVFGL